MNFSILFENQNIFRCFVFGVIFIGLILLSMRFILKKQIYYNYFFYFITLAGLFLLKIYYRNTQTDNLLWILKPTSILTGILTGIKFTFVSLEGYVHPALEIVIDKSCAGVNFFILCFFLTVFKKLNNCNSFKELSINYIIMLFLSFLITIIANSFRITGALFIEKLINNAGRLNWLHRAEGILVYLTILIVYYFLLERIKVVHLKN